MHLGKAALAVLIAPLIGSLVWLVQTMLRSQRIAEELRDPSFSMFSTGMNDPGGMMQLLMIGWFFGLLLTVIVGLPLGFVISLLLRRADLEGAPHYIVAGAATAFAASTVLPAVGGFSLAIAVTGAILGAAFWYFVRKPAIAAEQAAGMAK